MGKSVAFASSLVARGEITLGCASMENVSAGQRVSEEDLNGVRTSQDGGGGPRTQAKIRKIDYRTQRHASC